MNKTLLYLFISIKKEQRKKSSIQSFNNKKIIPFYILVLLFLIKSTFSFSQEILAGLTSAGGAAGGGTAFSMKTTGSDFTVLRKFINAGSSPKGDLTKGTDGNFYGVTPWGNSGREGTIFKMSSNGTLTVIKNLEYATGVLPYGSLTRGTDGNFYGMTAAGGLYADGTIFKITSTGIFNVIKNFDTDSTGGDPYGSLVLGGDGNFYGMTNQGGTNGSHTDGTIFKITPTGIFIVLKNLNESITGSHPYGSLVIGNDGNFYGMTNDGGTYGYGTVFKITPTGTLTVLHNLNSGTDGYWPRGSLIKGSDGNFYGMTQRGGSTSYGTVFKITSTGTFTVIGNFDYFTGIYPTGSLVLGSDGNFYGMTSEGGNYGDGTIFKITSTGFISVLHHLYAGADGGNPQGSLYKNSDGYFYGMTSAGGPSNNGTIFKISSTGSFSVLVRLPDNGKGMIPQESLLQAKDGYFYGATSEGSLGNGSIYKLCTSGSFTTLNVLDGTSNGGYPKGSLVQGTDGYFYGTTYEGGIYGYGTIFKMSSEGNIIVLKNLDGTTTGGHPYGSLVQGSDCTFFGMTFEGGSNGVGTIFKITSAGKFTILRNLNTTSSGYYPYGSLVKGSEGNYYGMTYYGGSGGDGTIFKITSSGSFTVIKNFYSSSTGGNPTGSLRKGSDGNFYGMTYRGGSMSYGTVFKITPTGKLIIIKNLDGATTGGNPQGDLVQASDGVFYGMTSAGGTYKAGTIFQITSGGIFTVLRHLNPATDGSIPLGSLVIQKPNPEANPQSVTMIRGTTKIKLTGSGGTLLTYIISTSPVHGTAFIYKDTLAYTPAVNYIGKDSLYFYSTWGCQRSAPAKIIITITPTTTIAQTERRPITNGSLSDGNGKLTVTVSPNPSPAFFTLFSISSNNNPVTIRVLDVTGRTVEIRSITANRSVRLGDNYRPGLYFVQVVQGTDKKILKLLKAN